MDVSDLTCMDVFFIDINETGRNVIHGFGCPLSKSGDREFLGLYSDLHSAKEGALSKVRKVITCDNCCTENSEINQSET